jgi:dehydrogenase/reductase SDR family protein 7B
MSRTASKHFGGKIVWITGASSGIGEALAKEMAGYGCRLILSARRTEELERVKRECRDTNDDITLIPFDLSSADESEKAVAQVLSHFGTVDYLFNNGGISQRTSVMDTSLEMDRKIMEVNYFSGIILTKALLPAMIENGGGHIIAVSSISGLFGFPLRSAYSASKHAVNGFYETLGFELREKGIRTTVVCPGRVRTNISFHALDVGGKPHGVMDKAQEEGISPESCIKSIIRSVIKNRRLVLIGRKELIPAYLKRFIPSLFYWLIIKIKPA